MASGHNDPKLLYAISGIKAYHIENGREESLTPTGAQTLSLLMVPTSSPFSGLSSADPQSEAPEEDFYLHLHLPPELDLPLPATTQIYHQPPSSYLIPRWDLGPDSGAFTRIEFPGIGKGKGGSQEDVDTFETILAQCTAFLERAAPPKGARPKKVLNEKEKEPLPAYDPSSFKPGEAYVTGSSSSHAGGQIVLIDEENGSVVGELSEGFTVVEDSKMRQGSKEPVEITMPQNGSNKIGVAPVSTEYLEMAMHPAYKKSQLVGKAAMASRLIVTTSGYVSNTLLKRADTFTQTTKPNEKALTFTPTTHTRVRKVHTFTEGAAGLSAKTVGQVSKYAQNLGATLTRKQEKANHRGLGPDGQPIDNYKPGLLNKSLIAFSTIADGIDQAGRSLLASTSSAATTVVGHKYGAEAGEISKSIGGGFTNVGLVYIDASGVSRKAIVKSVAKGMVVGRMKGGGEVIVGGGDGGAIINNPSASSSTSTLNWKEREARQGRHTDDVSMSGGRDSPGVVGFGRAAPPAYGTGPGESIEGQPADTKRRYE